MKRPPFVTGILVALLISSAAKAEEPVPLLHFDAGDGTSITADHDRLVAWKDLSGKGVLASPGADSRPLYNPTDRSIDFDGASTLLRFSKSPSFSLGAMAVWIVASADTTAPGQYFFGAPAEARFNLKTDAHQFMIELGREGHTPKRGPDVDAKDHLFELWHFSPCGCPDQTRPGRFVVDGKSNGRPFSRNTDDLSQKLTFGANADGTGFLKGRIHEILVFDHEPSPAQAQALRESLAKKWGLTLFPPVALGATLTPVPVTQPGEYGSFGIYNQSPESPDGSRLAYIVFDQAPVCAAPMAPFSIWIADRDLQHRRLLKKSEVMTNNHNGAFLQWIDNHHLAYCGGHLTHLPNGTKTTRAAYVIDVDTGAMTCGPFTDGFLGDGPKNGHFLFTVDEDASNLGPRGLYEIDAQTGKARCLFKVTDFASYAGKFSWAGFKKDPLKWMITHADYSPLGTRISLEVAPGGGVTLLFTCRSDGTELRFWGTDKPLHEHWFDEDTLCGADEITNDGYPDDLSFRRWNLNHEVVETLAGPVNHTAYSPDRRWFAGETFYWNDPVILSLYKRDTMKPAASIDVGDVQLIWGYMGHVNPSFSRDGKRLYFHRATAGGLKQPCYVDLSSLVAPNPIK